MAGVVIEARLHGLTLPNAAGWPGRSTPVRGSGRRWENLFIWTFSSGLLVSLLLVGCASHASIAPGASESGIVGVVIEGPSCPVELLKSPCPGRPVRADVRVQAATPATSTR